MNKMKKCIAFLLACGMTLGICACNTGKANSSSSSVSSSTSSSTSSASVYTSYTPEKLTSNGVDVKDYVIIISANAQKSTQYAANELQKYFELATDSKLEIKTDAVAASDYEIVLGNTNRVSDVDYTTLGNEGFTLKSVGDKLFIAANEDSVTDSRGTIYGVYTYLEMLGYRFYATGVEKIPEAEDVYVAKDVDETQIPRFTFRDLACYATMGEENTSWSIKQKVNSYFTRALTAQLGGSCEFACGSGDASGLVHTSFRLVPETLLETHPEYFALNAETGERMAGEWNGQICYTNEGAYQYMKDSVRGWLNANPNSEYMSISINDNRHMCECDNCKASDEQYGTSGTVLKFTNRMATELAEEGYTQKFIFLSFWDTAPIPKGGVVPADNVVVQLAIDCCQAHGLEKGRECDIGNTFGDDEGKTSLQEWGAISKGLMIYGYAGCYRSRQDLRIVPNYKSFLNTMRYYADNTKAEGHFCDIAISNTSGEFWELRSYIISKITWNPYMSEEEMWYHINDFLQGYYGEGSAEYLYEYIQLTVEQVGDKCWQNNLGNLEDRDLFFADGTPVADKLEFMEEVNELWADAMECCDVGPYFARLERAYIQVMYYELTYIAEGHIELDPDMQDYYMELQQKLEDTMSKYGL